MGQHSTKSVKQVYIPSGNLYTHSPVCASFYSFSLNLWLKGSTSPQWEERGDVRVGVPETLNESSRIRKALHSSPASQYSLPLSSLSNCLHSLTLSNCPSGSIGKASKRIMSSMITLWQCDHRHINTHTLCACVCLCTCVRQQVLYACVWIWYENLHLQSPDLSFHFALRARRAWKQMTKWSDSIMFVSSHWLSVCQRELSCCYLLWQDSWWRIYASELLLLSGWLPNIPSWLRA